MVDGVRRIVELVSSGDVQAIRSAAPIDRLGEELPSGNASDEEVAAWALARRGRRATHLWNGSDGLGR